VATFWLALSKVGAGAVLHLMSFCRAHCRPFGRATSCLGRVVDVVVCCGLVGAVWNVGVSSIDGVVVRGVIGIIVLHTLKRGEPELSPSLKAESSSLGYSSRTVCNDGDLLWVMPMNPASKLAPSMWPIQVVKEVGRCLE
jgi:hypothetical protein